MRVVVKIGLTSKGFELSFWNSVLASIARKFESVLNQPFENRYIAGLFALGSILVSGSVVYKIVTKGKAEYKGENYSLALELTTGPEMLFALLGASLIGFSIAIFWKMKISTLPQKSEFDRLVEAGIDSHKNYLVETAFKDKFGYLPALSIIKKILEMDDSLSKFLDYKKGAEYVTLNDASFVFKNVKRLNRTGVIHLVIYFFFAILAVGAVQLVAISISADNVQEGLVFLLLSLALSAVSYLSLDGYGKTAAARRLVNGR